MSDRKGLADRLEQLAAHYVRRAEIMARYADTVPAGDPYRPVADADADGDHQKAADLQAVLRIIRQKPSVDEVARAIAAADGVTWDGYTVTFSHVPGSDDDGPTDRYFRAAQAIHAMYRRGEP